MNFPIKKTVKLSKAVKLEVTDGKKVVGRAFLYIIKNGLHKEPYGLMEDLFVEEEYRSQGLGKKLLLGLIAEAKKQKCYKLIGNSRTFRTQVHSFYEKFGFKKYGYEFRMNLK